MAVSLDLSAVQGTRLAVVRGAGAAGSMRGPHGPTVLPEGGVSPALCLGAVIRMGLLIPACPLPRQPVSYGRLLEVSICVLLPHSHCV